MAESQQQWDLGKLDRVLQQYVNYCRRKEIKRTLRGHIQAIGNWIRKAQEFEERDGREAAGGDALPVGGHGFSNGGDVGGISNQQHGLSHKLAAYRAFLAKNPRQAQEYLERQPARVQAVLKGEVD